MKLTADQIAQNWDELLNVIKTEFTGDRKAKLLSMYTDLEDRMALAPASSFNHYHHDHHLTIIIIHHLHNQGHRHCHHLLLPSPSIIPL